MSLHVRDSGGVLREITDLQVRDASGVLRVVQEGWVRDATGTLRKFYLIPSVTLPADSTVLHNQSSNNPTISGIEINTDNTVYRYLFDGTKAAFLVGWQEGYDPATELWVACTHISGDVPNGSASDGVFRQMSVNYLWQVSDTNSGAAKSTSQFRVDIATDSGGSNIIETVTYTPEADYNIL